VERGVAVLAALSQERVSRRLRAVAIVTVVVIAATSGVAAIFGGRDASGIADLAAAALLVQVPIAVVAEFRSDGAVTVQSLLAALCVYLVFGLFFANVASSVGYLSGAPYFAGHPQQIRPNTPTSASSRWPRLVTATSRRRNSWAERLRSWKD